MQRDKEQRERVQQKCSLCREWKFTAEEGMVKNEERGEDGRINERHDAARNHQFRPSVIDKGVVIDTAIATHRKDQQWSGDGVQDEEP